MLEVIGADVKASAADVLSLMPVLVLLAGLARRAGCYLLILLPISYNVESLLIIDY